VNNDHDHNDLWNDLVGEPGTRFLNLDEEDRRAIEALAREWGLSVEETVNRLIAKGLEASWRRLNRFDN
jgi:hypothetical protein